MSNSRQLYKLLKDKENIEALRAFIAGNPDLDLNECEIKDFQLCIYLLRKGTVAQLKLFIEEFPGRLTFDLNYQYNSCLVDLAENTEEVKRYFADARIVATFNDGTNVLHVAALSNDTAYLRKVHAENPELIDAKDSRGFDAIFFAAFSGAHASVSYLESKMSEPHKVDSKHRGYALSMLLLGELYAYDDEYISQAENQFIGALNCFQEIDQKLNNDYVLAFDICIAHASLLLYLGLLTKANDMLTKARECADKATVPNKDRLIASELQAKINRKLALVNEVTKWGFKAQDVDEDGDCFVTAAIDQMQSCDHFAGHELSVDSVRRQIADHMLANRSSYEAFVTEDSDDEAYSAEDPGDLFDRYVIKIAQPGCWLDQLAISAFSRTFKVDVVIISSSGSTVVQKNKNSSATLYFGHELVPAGELDETADHSDSSSECSKNPVGMHYQSLHRIPGVQAELSIEDKIAQATVDEFEQEPVPERVNPRKRGFDSEASFSERKASRAKLFDRTVSQDTAGTGSAPDSTTQARR